jgi:hypothetical protein
MACSEKAAAEDSSVKSEGGDAEGCSSQAAKLPSYQDNKAAKATRDTLLGGATQECRRAPEGFVRCMKCPLLRRLDSHNIQAEMATFSLIICQALPVMKCTTIYVPHKHTAVVLHPERARGAPEWGHGSS